jgi:flagellar biosynthesis protein FlhG
MLDFIPIEARPRESRPLRAPGPVIWAVASGKGGVGKSVVSSSLAIALAETGPRAVAVDLDLGGANLHTLFGAERARRTLTDFLAGRIPSLEEALTPTSVPGVRLLSGARAALDAANAPHAHKQKVLRGLKRIDAGHVVLDLGAGSHGHTLDAFVAADRRILVVTPEATALDNAYHFLKAAYFRALREVAREPEVHAALASVLEEARRGGATPRELVEAASRADARAAARLRTRLRTFEIDLVVNRADLGGGARAGEQIAVAARAQLGASVRLAGTLLTDAAIPSAVERGVPAMQLFPGSRFRSEVSQLAASLLHGEPTSAARALASVAPPPARAAERAAPAAALPPFVTGSSPGRFLRECRERLGLDLAALHERTRIRHRHLEAIEAEQFALLPTDVYLREYVRQLARALGATDADLIADQLVARARAKREAGARPPAPAPPAPVSEVPSSEVLIAAIGDDPELDEDLTPVAERTALRVVTSAAEVAAFLAPAGADSSARARRRRRRMRR